MVADGDIFYLAAEYRQGTTGLRLLRESERLVRAFCAAKPGPHTHIYLVNKEKTHFVKNGKPRVGPVLARLGFRHIENHHAKLVEIR